MYYAVGVLSSFILKSEESVFSFIALGAVLQPFNHLFFANEKRVHYGGKSKI